MAYEHGTSTRRLPPWLRRPIATPGLSGQVEDVLGELELHTVCQSAKCPNRGECFSSGTATFLIMGDACTRGCRFCAVGTRTPEPLDPEEPARLAEAVRRMELSHIVVTTVTRDDLPDGGAAHFVAVIEALRAVAPDAAIEVLTSDFAGRLESVDRVVDAAPDVFNHNLETVPRLYADVRPGADYRRSLDVLAHARQRAIAVGIDMPTKSGLML
ncbi:MAG: lipoyl synthase, partial [Coriobacteriia bacterium]|nr:lipoyl synthase [Coriobacteriia bacterium]